MRPGILLAGLGLILGTLAFLSPDAARAQYGTRLPIASGIWIYSDVEKCATTESVMIFSNGVEHNFYLLPNNPNPIHQKYVIRQTVPAKGGFTRVFVNDNNFSTLELRATGANTAIRRTINVRASGFRPVEEKISRCQFSQLKPKMREQIRRLVPEVSEPDASPAGRAAAPANAMPAPVAPFNIAPGHYVDEAFPCSDEGSSLFYYDGRRWGYVGAGAARIFEPVAKARKTARGWTIDYSELRVRAPGKITIVDDNIGNTDFRWCPAGFVSRAMRVN